LFGGEIATTFVDKSFWPSPLFSKFTKIYQNGKISRGGRSPENFGKFYLKIYQNLPEHSQKIGNSGKIYQNCAR
jgi:hypothetical protein